MNLLLYVHTLRHLTVRQITNRLGRTLVKPRLDHAPPPALNRKAGLAVSPLPKPESYMGQGWFLFHNQSGSIEEEGWDHPARAKLWRYHLHYFDHLQAISTKADHDLLNRWIDENPPGKGTGWEAYPTSLRIVNWIKWHWRGAHLSPRQIHSLAVQTRWLRKRLEFHLMGNHLLANAKALLFSSLYFKAKEADHWLDQGLTLFKRELQEQVLGDGGHFELSPHYHALVLDDVLDVWNALAGSGHDPDFLSPYVAPMLHWLSCMTHGDRAVAQFNDSVLNAAPALNSLISLAKRLGVKAPTNLHDKPKLTHLHESGYVRLQDEGLCLIADLASVGADYQPGHAHSDTLSFELSLGSERVIVNQGIDTYEAGERRCLQRSTRAHSTVEIAGQNSSEVWSSFRVARRARMHDVFVEQSKNHCSFGGWHDGYARLGKGIKHHRQWIYEKPNLTIIDNVNAGHWPAIARFHLAPGIKIERLCTHRLALFTKGNRHLIFSASSPITIEESNWHPGFGQNVPSQTLIVPIMNGTLRTEIELTKNPTDDAISDPIQKGAIP